MKDRDIGRLFERNRAVFDWCLRGAARELSAGNPAHAADWCSVAAWLAAFEGWFGALVSRELESLIQQISLALPRNDPPRPSGDRPRWLHIMTTAFTIGGHTNMVCRWARTDASVQHDLIVTDQYCPFPDKLGTAIRQGGGRVHVLGSHLSVLEKAQFIWDQALRTASVVVLHVHPHDVAALLPFARTGPVPVLMMNHVDHLFWAGASVPDLIMEFRELGANWSRWYRGTDRTFLLPLPLECPPSPPCPAGSIEARRRLSLPENGVMLLSVATPYKFEPSGEWNFHDTLDRILSTNPGAFFVGIGPSRVGRWAELACKFPDRVFLTGQVDVSQSNNDYYLAADIALGVFPFASQTSLLESALHGLACVATPKRVPYGFDDVSFPPIDSPDTQEDYVALASRLITDAAFRAASAAALRQRVTEDHCGTHWLRHLENLKAQTPPEHRTYSLTAPVPMPRETLEFWAFFNRLTSKNPLHHLHGRLIAQGLAIVPRHDQALRAALSGDSLYSRFPDLAYWTRRLRFSLGRIRRRAASACRRAPRVSAVAAGA